MVTTINIKGMSCGHCVKAVTRVIEQVQGISNVQVDLERGSATLEHADSLDMQKLRELVEGAGYQVG